MCGPCPFKTFKKHSLFFVPGAPSAGPAHRPYCPFSLVSSTPCTHCVCALVLMAGAGCSAILGSLSLLTPTPLLLPGAGVRGLASHRAVACILPLSPGAGFLQVWMWSGCCPVSSGLSFRISCICCIFKNINVFRRRFPLSYSRHHLGSSLLPFSSFASYCPSFPVP